MNILRGPRRIVCLTQETTETHYRIGEQDRIVGNSGFTSARLDRVRALDSELVLGFSDLQADTAAELIRGGIAVHVFNQRSVEEIFGFIDLLGAMVHAGQLHEIKSCDILQPGPAALSDGLAQRHARIAAC